MTFYRINNLNKHSTALLPPLLHVQLSGAFFQVRNLLDGGLSREYFYQSSTHECRVVRYSLSTLSLLE